MSASWMISKVPSVEQSSENDLQTSASRVDRLPNERAWLWSSRRT
jgi:hypothetical protein